MNPTHQQIDQSLLPQRLREKSFREYESVIALCVERFPDVVKIKDFRGLSVLTYVARLRDAMSSLNMYNWHTTTINIPKFLQCYSPMKVSHQGNTIVVGSNEAIKNPTVVPFQAPLAEIDLLPSVEVFYLNTFEEKKLICRLAAARMFAQTLKVQGISTEEIILLEANYDVEISQSPDGTCNIL